MKRETAKQGFRKNPEIYHYFYHLRLHSYSILTEQLSKIMTFCRINHKDSDFVEQLHLYLLCGGTGKEMLSVPLLIGPK